MKSLQSRSFGKKYSQIYDCLECQHPDAKPELIYKNNFELLTAVILSAQCTDVRVNAVTSALFGRAPDAAALAGMDVGDIEEIIKSCGLFRSKARYIQQTAKLLCERFGGEVPSGFNELVSLPGVSRKTANVVRSVGFGIPAIAVDTHVFRVSRRIGLSDGKSVEDVERDLRKRFPENVWNRLHHLLIFHGRRVCDARAPRCGECSIRDYCRAYLRNDFSYKS